jgi:methylated-DNA-[protein]-cysteine S-methyltransferase
VGKRPHGFYIHGMKDLDFTLFGTPIGDCGIVWSDRGVVGVQLAERRARATRARVLRRFASAREAPPLAQVQAVIDGIVALLEGKAQAFDHVVLDLDGVAQFNRRVYQIARGIPLGATLSYGAVAERLGDRNLARDVARALSENPVPIIVPCHRVVAADGKAGGFSAPGGVCTKLRLLSIEGAQTADEPMLFERLPWVVPPRRRA